jgi:hypothetical protein
MVLVYDNNLISSYDFEILNDKTIFNQFLLVTSRYEIDYKGKSPNYYGIDSDQLVDLELDLIKMTDIDFESIVLQKYKNRD